MARKRFVTPGIVRLPLSDGDWIDVRRELTIGEARGFVYGAIVEKGGEAGGYRRELDATAIAKVEAYLTGWSLEDERGPVELSRDAILALDLPTWTEIWEAVIAHEAAIESSALALRAATPAPATDGGLPTIPATPIAIGSASGAPVSDLISRSAG